jgi:hypothetical protein
MAAFGEEFNMILKKPKTFLKPSCLEVERERTQEGKNA